MKALVFCDGFFTQDVFEKELRKFTFWNKVKRVYCKVDWPENPLRKGKEINEFVDYPLQALNEIKETEILVTQMAKVDKLLIEKGQSLKVIVCLRSGPTNIDVKYAREKKLPIIFTPERSTLAVAEFTLGLMISCCRRITQANYNLSQGLWNQNQYFSYSLTPRTIYKSKIGLIGFGNIARALSCLLIPFGCSIYSFDPYVKEELMEKYLVKKVSLEKLLRISDIVSLHVRLTSENNMMVGEKEFNLMKKGAIFINTSRGRLVDEGAILNALKEGKLSFVALDTFWEEPLRTISPFANFENVILTPHIAGASYITAKNGAYWAAKLVASYFSHKLNSKYLLN